MMIQADDHEGLVRVTASAIVGAGLNLREGQVVPPELLGEYAEALCREGAVVPAVRPLDPGQFTLK